MLAVLTISAPAGNVRRHASPHPAGGDETSGSPDAWVGKTVDGSENSPVVREGNDWTDGAGGGRAEESRVTDLQRDDIHA